MTSVRQPAVAGSFYDKDAHTLLSQVNELLDSSVRHNIAPSAIIVPHAGYCYSGAVAGKCFSTLKSLSEKPTKIILLGPSHRVALSGCALPTHSEFATPCGNVIVDQSSCRLIVDNGLADYDDNAHLLEHSLEVQLPFIHSLFKHVEIIPVVVGDCSPEKVEALLQCVLSELSKREALDVVIVVSTDLSHYNTYEEAKVHDRNTINDILKGHVELTPEQACGCRALNGLLLYAKKVGWQAKLESYKNSGDVFGDKSRVVGYAAFTMC